MESFEADLYDYYSERLGQSQASLHPAENRRSLAETLAWLRGRAPGNRLLDVGCGEGQLVSVAQDLGWKARGIDLSRSAIAICQSFGLPCEAEDVFSPRFEPGSFDVVTMVELIEHVPDPGAMLARAETLLAPGGLLFITTPNWSSLTRFALGPAWRAIHREHVHYFTPRSLKGLLRARTGLQVEGMQTRGVNAAALRAILTLHRPVPTRPDSNPEFAQTQALRARLHSNALGRAMRAVGNLVFRATGTGESIVFVARRPRA